MDHITGLTLIVVALFHLWSEPMPSITPRRDLVAELDEAMTELRNTVKNA